eukprot:359832-Chlamydomonas_euryale.AAC.17
MYADACARSSPPSPISAAARSSCMCTPRPDCCRASCLYLLPHAERGHVTIAPPPPLTSIAGSHTWEHLLLPSLGVNGWKHEDMSCSVLDFIVDQLPDDVAPGEVGADALLRGEAISGSGTLFTLCDAKPRHAFSAPFPGSGGKFCTPFCRVVLAFVCGGVWVQERLASFGTCVPLALKAEEQLWAGCAVAGCGDYGGGKRDRRSFTWSCVWA